MPSKIKFTYKSCLNVFKQMTNVKFNCYYYIARLEMI